MKKSRALLGVVLLWVKMTVIKNPISVGIPQARQREFYLDQLQNIEGLC